MSANRVENLPSEEEPECYKCQCDTHIKFVKYQYIWTINNFSLCSDSMGQEMISPIFPQGTKSKVKWCLKVYPGGLDKDCGGNISVFLYVVSCDDVGVQANYKLRVLDVNHKEMLKLEGSHCFLKELDWGYKKMFPRNKVINDQFILSCEISARVDIVNIWHQSLTTTTQQCSLSKDFQIVFENQEFSDVVLVAGTKKFQAHKVILGARSPVFRAMFLHEMKENMENQVEILDVEHNVLKEVLRFIYTGQVEDLKSIANPLLSAADKYSLQSLKDMCEEELSNNVSVENAAEILVLSDLHNASKLKIQTKKYITAYAKEITETSGWELMIRTHPHLVTEVFCDLASHRFPDQEK